MKFFAPAGEHSIWPPTPILSWVDQEEAIAGAPGSVLRHDGRVGVGEARSNAETLAIGRALIRLREIARLPKNWDGKKSKAPSPLAVSIARQALTRLAEAVERVRIEPQVSPVSTGGIEIGCDYGGRELGIYAPPEGGTLEIRRSGGGETESRHSGLVDEVRGAARWLVG